MKTLFETKSRTEASNAFRLPDDTHVRCVHLRTPDLARALDFYQRVIGVKLIERGESEASLSATGLAPALLVFSEDRCASRRPEHTTGLYHFAIRYPTRRDLAQPGGPRSALPLVPITALERYGNTDEIASFVAFLASSEASYITGASLLADGGYAARNLRMGNKSQ